MGYISGGWGKGGMAERTHRLLGLVNPCANVDVILILSRGAQISYKIEAGSFVASQIVMEVRDVS